ncbi:ALK and LTK ligand 2a-like [Trichomycterus rosablanca]|uniref:ALK and LTK ligand 2a-like n=1 Tax=Trichomycterus rosablanca TaxID=2290929 RepID=UPI002F35C8F6
MRALRIVLVIMGLVLLTCPAARGVTNMSTKTDTDMDAGDSWNHKSLFAQLMEMIKLSKDDNELNQSITEKESKKHRLRTERGEQIREIFPRDLRKKKILEHLTGPLYFSPKCRKHVYRLYHNTRDCTIPAYYKRCARLLVRLAGTPTCLES